MTDAALADELQAYCRREWDSPELRVTGVTQIPEGHSGFTYFVDMSGADRERYVLRLPPPGAAPKGSADVARQGRIMRALSSQGVPVPDVPIICERTDAVGGRPFILMEAIDGVRADAAARVADEKVLAAATVAAMKQIHAVPLEGTGIGDEEPTTLPAELNRWAQLMARAPEEITVGSEQVLAALLASVPERPAPTLVHGDFTYGNLLYRGDRVAGVLDWEIAQIGEPLMDLGSLCVIAKRHDFPLDPNPSGAIHASVDWLISEYGVTGVRPEWFVALSYYKYAAIVGYNTMLHRRGKRPDPIYDLMPDTVTGLIGAAAELLR